MKFFHQTKTTHNSCKLFKSTYQLIVGLLGLATCTLAAASNPAGFFDEFRHAVKEGKASYALEVENDSLLLQFDDGLYTSGIRLTLSYALRHAETLTLHGGRIGQELYTASNINLPAALVGPPDHPYAGWLYAGLFRESHHADGSRTKVGLDFGCLGPCAQGRESQDFLHRILDQPRPKGWDRQVKNEVGLVAYGEIAPSRWKIGETMDITPSLHGRFGNIFTDVGADLTLRAGRLNLLPDQPTLHGFARIGARAVAYNATLQGGYFSDNNPHTVKPRRLVPQAEVGAVWITPPFNVLLSIVRRGNEIEDLPNSVGIQNFARLAISYTPE